MVSFKDLKIGEFKGEFECFCGRTHSIDTEIYFSKNALENLSDIVTKFLPIGNILYITAKDIREKSRQIERILYKTHMLNIVEYDSNFKPCLEDVAKLTEVPDGYLLVISFGSGSITDIAKYYAELKKLPLISIASAPSNTAYLTDYSEFYNNGLKIIYNSKSPNALIVDFNLMLGCPKNMIASGFGSVLGSAVALFDWQISTILTETVMCENTADLVSAAFENVVSVQDKLINARIDSIEVLTQSLLYISVAQKFTMGKLQGAETIIADVLRFLLKEKAPKLQGEVVCLCLSKLIKIYKMFLNTIATSLLPPADLTGRAELLAKFAGLSELHFLELFLQKDDYEHELYIHKLVEYRDELYNKITVLDKTINLAQAIFKRIYADKGYFIQNYITAEDFKKAVYLSPIFSQNFTLLTFMTDLGYFERIIS